MNNLRRFIQASVAFALIFTLFHADAIPASSTITLVVTASQEQLHVGEDARITISMDNAAGMDLASFSFKIQLPDGLKFKPGSGEIDMSFRNATGMFIASFDESPIIMVSGFGDSAYNGGALDIASFTCVAEVSGDHMVTLNEINLFSIDIKAIPAAIEPVTVSVSDNEALEGEIDNGEANGDDKSSDDKSGDDKSGDDESGGDESGGDESGDITNNDTAVVIPGGSSQSGWIPEDEGNAAPVESQNDDDAVWVNPFSDVNEGDWFYDYVASVHGNGIMIGTSSKEFSPNIPVTRAMFTQIISNFAGADLSPYSSSRFSDVEKEKWYSNSVEWAADMGIIEGVGNGLFDPDANITREQMAVMLHRYMQDFTSAVGTDSAPFNDKANVSLWAIDAVEIMQSLGIIRGKPGNMYDPQGISTRAEIATVFSRLMDIVD